LDTSESALLELGRDDLLDNLYNVDLSDWKDVYGFARDPAAYFDGLDEFDPTVLYTDGFTTLQVHSADEYVLSLDSGLKSSAMRDAGVVTVTRDWDAIKRLTMRYLIHFFSSFPSAAKIITFLENSREDSNNRITTGPLVQGAARNMMNAGFDVFMRTTAVKDKTREEGKKVVNTRYRYTFRDDSGKVTVKLRGRSKLPDEVDADPLKLWNCVRDKKLTWEEAEGLKEHGG